MIAIIDYGIGNLGSIVNMLTKIGAESVRTADPAVLARAQALILPGVGSFDVGMRQLRATGIVDLLNRRVLEERTPILGICLGMQLLSRGSEEGGEPGLAWLDATTERIRVEQAATPLRVPHMGWNEVTPRNGSPLLNTLGATPRFYFAHSYHVVCREPSDVAATVTYGGTLTAAVTRGNIYGTQFHPEKSHRFGLQLMTNFVERTRE